MSKFTTHTLDSAPEKSKAMLEGAQKSLGFVPNLFANMAEAPALLEGYMSLAKIFDSGSLDATERQIVMMTNNYLNNCTYCMAAHTVISRGQKVPEDVIEALRHNTPIGDAKLEALRVFSVIVNESRGNPSADEVQTFLDAGYTQQAVLEVVLGTAVKVMSNYTNHIAQTRLDDAFKSAQWSKDSAVAA